MIEVIDLLKKMPLGTTIIKRKHGWSASLKNRFVDYEQTSVRGETLTEALTKLLAKVKAGKIA